MATNKNEPFAKTEMLIRRPVPVVFEAFVNPEITTRFWFTKSTGKLEAGKQLKWTWEMYDLTETVFVKAIEPNKKITLELGNEPDMTIVEWSFKEMKDNATFVSIVNYGFKGDTEKIIEQLRASTEGFTFVLAGLKAYLEHNIQLNLIADRFPNGIA
jgi:uncharacterized protein YndB with AHSA1/START domain